jgi:hypothetical protein
VFGPSPNSASPNQAISDLLDKRKQIRDHLVLLGHTAEFPEDLVNPTGSMPADNVWFQEIALIKDYDMIVLLVESPGSNNELGLLGCKPDLARKSQCFIRAEYSGGLAYSVCEGVKTLGGDFHSFAYPTDITECHLLTKVEQQVQKIQVIKFLS